MIRTSVVVLVALVVAGCSAPIAGRPVAHADSPTSATVVRPHPSDLEIQQRCLLNRTQWHEFALDSDGDLVVRDREPKGKECFYDNNIGYFDYVFTITDGVRYWTTTPTTERVGSTAPVRGFPTFERTGSPNTGRCDLIVDVADDQALDVYTGIDDRPAARFPSTCAMARWLVEIAVSTVSP